MTPTHSTLNEDYDTHVALFLVMNLPLAHPN